MRGTILHFNMVTTCFTLLLFSKRTRIPQKQEQNFALCPERVSDIFEYDAYTP